MFGLLDHTKGVSPSLQNKAPPEGPWDRQALIYVSLCACVPFICYTHGSIGVAHRFR